MKKYQKISILIIAVFAFFASIVYAATENSTKIAEEVNQATQVALTAKTESVLAPLSSDVDVKKIDEFTDKLNNKKLSNVYTNDYIVSLDSSSKQLVGIYKKEIKPQKSSNDKTIAQNFIEEKYKQLNLPSDYKLVYLEKNDDYVWEADFQKEYDGIFNMYEAVKVFFNPETQEIAALTVFNEKYEDNSNKDVITSESAVTSATSNLNISSDKIKKSELTLIKSNNFYDSKNTDSSIHKAWVLTTDKENKIYVDATSGEVIGGDSLNV